MKGKFGAGALGTTHYSPHLPLPTAHCPHLPTALKHHLSTYANGPHPDRRRGTSPPPPTRTSTTTRISCPTPTRTRTPTRSVERTEAVDEVGPVERVASDANTHGLAQALVGGLSK